jgi:hypothetical protein
MTEHAELSQASTEELGPLMPLLSRRYALGIEHVAVCGLFVFFMLYTSYIPLFFTDIWGHVEYGRWILEHGSLPTEDPFLVLGQGMRVVDNAWLSQLIFATTEMKLGADGLGSLFGVVVVAAYLFLARTFYLQSARLSLAVLGVFLAWSIGWSRHAIIRPEIFGVLCFSILLWLIVRRRQVRSTAKEQGGNPTDNVSDGATLQGWSLWLGVPLLFMLWANLHGSFVVGLALLGCQTLGRAMEIGGRTWSIGAILGDRTFRRWVVLTELALAATLVNPYGMDLLIQTVQFSQNPNLRNILEWYPLKLIDLEGLHFSFSVVLLILALRFGRRRMAPGDVLLMTLLAVSTALTIRMIAWYAPVVTLVLMPQIADIVERLWPRRQAAAEDSAATTNWFTVRSFRYTLICLVPLELGFMLLPVVHSELLGGTPRATKYIYNSGTPLKLTEYLRQNAPSGLLYNPQWWGDWLVKDGPAGIQVFMTTNVHLAPAQVWRDYMRISDGNSGWERTLDRYNVKTMVVDKKRQPQLAHLARRSAQWKLVREDDLSLLLGRKQSTAPANEPE